MEIEAAEGDLVVVDKEHGVAGEGGEGRDVAAVEDGEEEGGAAERGPSVAEGGGGIGWARTPGTRPEGAACDLEGDSGDGEVEEGAEGGRRGAAPVREAGGGGEGGGEDCAEVGWEGEGEVGLDVGQLGLGEARGEGDAGGAEEGGERGGERGE